MRDAGYIQNTENRCLIFGLYNKHVGFSFWIVEQIQRSQESISRAQPTSKITGAAAQILMLAVKAANKAIAGMVEAEEIIRILDFTKDQYKDGVEELDALGVIDIFRSANAPAGYKGYGFVVTLLYRWLRKFFLELIQSPSCENFWRPLVQAVENTSSQRTFFRTLQFRSPALRY